MLKAFTDGACRKSNPGMCSCAFVLYKDDQEIETQSKYLGPNLYSNNYAEYQGLLLCLEHLYRTEERNVDIYCDSALVVNQVNQKWTINAPELKPLAAKAYGMLLIGNHNLYHIKGHDGNLGNERADQLCNECLDAHMEDYAASKA